MDLVRELEQRLAGISTLGSLEGVKSAIRHVNIAERHLDSGRRSGDHELFNDVIYRTNQAFEGMLKEAYRVFAAKDPMKLSPHEIEQHLINENRLTKRVLALFQNYRQDWRNPATHDHTLLFKEQEALLAIVSVSAFAIVLLDQIVEATTASNEKARAGDIHEQVQKLLAGYERKRFPVQVALILTAFSAELLNADVPLMQTEASTIGRLTGFMTSVDPDIEIIREPQLGGTAQPDFLLRKAEEDVFLELAGLGSDGGVREGAITQMASYLMSAKVRAGIVFVPPQHAGNQVQRAHVPFGTFEVILIAAKIDFAKLGGFLARPLDEV